MASSSSFYSSSSSSSRTWTYRVFASFHGPDVRKTFLSHLRKQLNNNGITMFDDQKIVRSHTIAPALTQAIKQSRISIIVLSKNYAFSSWCLDELLEILKCKEDIGQIVMTVFYGVSPSDVRKQTGEFGRSFTQTCASKTKEERRRWSKALNDVGNIAGEDFQNWDNESEMIGKIARDISHKLNSTISRDFENMVGIEEHLQKVESLLHFKVEDGAMMVGICGPAGIGKTTIARALHSRLSSNFQRTCFMENLRGSYNSGLDEYGLKLSLQEKLLSNILNENGMRIYHLGAIPERLCDQKVLIILDDVDDLKQLEALANETNWFGRGSRIIVTTENQELLEQHGINNTYHVDFPNKEEALNIFYKYAFRQSSVAFGFEKLSKRVIELCSNLPLGLRVMGSALRGKKEDEWDVKLHRLESSLDRDIEGVLRIGYDSLHENDQALFLLIAFFFNYKEDVHVMAMLAESNVDVILGLKTLLYKSLIQISTEGNIVMHKLLLQMGRQALRRQEPWKRQILIDTDEICHVLETETGSRSVMGISFDISTILDDIYISTRAFRRMTNLRFLRVYETRYDGNNISRVRIPEDMDFPPRLRLLHWKAYPKKSLPHKFNPKYLVELDLQDNKLEKLWDGTQPLPNLKQMDLLGSLNLKEIPDLSNATNLERLDLTACESLVEIPLSFGNLHKLEWLQMVFCVKLQVVPTHFNLASLKFVNMMGCSELRKFPDISTNITELTIADTMLEDIPESIKLWSRLESLTIFGSVTTLPFVVEKFLDRSGADIEKIPDCIKYLHGLKWLHIGGCPKLASLPELPGSLITLIADTCESLETVCFPFDSQFEGLWFPNCFKLDNEARRVIQQSLDACLPGSKIPAEFNHQAIGNSLTIRSDFRAFRICVLVSPKQQIKGDIAVLTHIRINSCSVDDNIFSLPNIRKEHLCLSHSELFDQDGWLEMDNEIFFEFSTTSQEVDIVECGVQILTDKTDKSRSSNGSYKSRSKQVYEDDDESFSDARNEFDESL